MLHDGKSLAFLLKQGELVANRLNSVRTDPESRAINLESSLLDGEKMLFFCLSTIRQLRGEYTEELRLLREAKDRGLLE